MRLPIALFALVAALTLAFWAFLGRPIAVPLHAEAGAPKVYCVSFAPFRDGQSPFDPATRISAQQVEEDLERVRKISDCVRTYATDFGSQHVPPLVKKLGMHMYLGIWIGDDDMRNRVQVETAIAFAKRYPDVIRAIIVGNEVLLRRDQPPAVLAGFIKEVKARAGVPVTYADVWEFWLRNPELAQLVDFITIHTLPYWEDIPIAADKAAAHIDATLRHVREAFPGKEVLIGEVGWPTAGRMREGALPSLSNQARLLGDVTRFAKAGGYHFNWIEVIDQPWKRKSEGTVGGYWGLFAAGADQPKYMPGDPVSDHPHWRLQAGFGLALALAVFGFALAGGGGKASRGTWFAIATMALAGGMLGGLMVEKLVLESLTAGDWAFGLARALVMLATLIVAAGALAGGTPVPALRRLSLRGAYGASWSERLVMALFLACLFFALQAALALAFDPRYRDFPAATLTIGLVPLGLMLALGKAAPASAPQRLLAFGLGVLAAIILIKEGIENWQAVWFTLALCGAAGLLARPLVQSRPDQQDGSGA